MHIKPKKLLSSSHEGNIARSNYIFILNCDDGNKYAIPKGLESVIYNGLKQINAKYQQEIWQKNQQKSIKQ